MWLRDYHFDGLRIDAVHAIFDSSAVHFLEQLSGEIKELEAHLGRHLVLIAESDLNDPRVVTPCEAGGYGIDAQWSDDFHHALHAAFTGECFGYYADFGKLEDLAKALKSAFVYDGEFSRFRGRMHGRRPRGLSGSRFLGYLQTHDQVGNRAKGERSSQLMSIDRLKIGAAIVFCSPFIPMLFQGEEFAASSPFLFFTDHLDPKLASAVFAGRRKEFAAHGWNADEVPDPQDPSTFERSKLDWSEVDSEPHRGILEWYRQLIALRRSLPALTDGRLARVKVQFSESDRWLLFRRGPVAIACNLAHTNRVVPLQARTILMSSSNQSAVRGDVIELAPDSVMIVEGD
jgi:maltooligosyltrehalose trehalohydrolase